MTYASKILSAKLYASCGNGGWRDAAVIPDCLISRDPWRSANATGILCTKLFHGEKRMDKEMYTDDYTSIFVAI